MARFAGTVVTTAGPVMTGAAAVVKVQTKLLAIAAPVRPVTPVVTVAVYIVLYARFVLGVKVATLPEAV